MPIRQATAPKPFLFTDERVEEGALLRAVRRLPKGGVVVFRHYHTPEDARQTLYRRLRTITRRRGILLLEAGPNRSRFADSDGWHFSNWRGRTLRRSPPISASAHNLADLTAAKALSARAVFISPVFATNSHKGARAMGANRLPEHGAAGGSIRSHPPAPWRHDRGASADDEGERVWRD